MGYYDDDDFEGFICICGDRVVVMHQDCKSLLTPQQLRDFRGRR